MVNIETGSWPRVKWHITLLYVISSIFHLHKTKNGYRWNIFPSCILRNAVSAQKQTWLPRGNHIVQEDPLDWVLCCLPGGCDWATPKQIHYQNMKWTLLNQKQFQAALNYTYKTDHHIISYTLLAYIFFVGDCLFILQQPLR